jgi:formylglycine-generating enzyme required for sulfatase activity
MPLIALLAICATAHAGVDPILEQLRLVNPSAMRRALADLEKMFPDRYPESDRLSARIDELAKQLPAVMEACHTSPDRAALKRAEALLAFQRELLVERNPLVDFERFLFIRRRERKKGKQTHDLALPQNWANNTQIKPSEKIQNQILSLAIDQPYEQARVLHRPERPTFVGDMDMHWDAGKILFSSTTPAKWELFELDIDGRNLRQVQTIPDRDVDNFDACYLPNDDILFTSTACFKAVPCSNHDQVANLFRLYRETGQVRQLTFEQDQDWCPTMLPDGRALYLRWEYSGLAHFVSRILFTMNPDGTEQRQYLGGGDYWPNAVFYARPCPGDPGKTIGIVTGHHGVKRMGELVLFDRNRPGKGVSSAVQRIPGYGKKVESVILDELVDESWPKFLHPYPLGSQSNRTAAATFFLVAAKLSPDSPRNFGIYLVDIYDNIVLLAADPDPAVALLEPLPVRTRPRPPVIVDRVDRQRQDATVFIQSIYHGDGLKGVPRGTVKKLRVIEYDFTYRNMSAKSHQIGLDGPWDIQRILGTVDVAEDGSAHFRIPANRPLAVQPLDQEGQALALMRSWFTGMPGERVSCVGCHEDPEDTPPPVTWGPAGVRPAQQIEPWYGPARGFGFIREVQPVLDHHCVGCHNGQPHPEHPGKPDLRAADAVRPPRSENIMGRLRFPPSYFALRRFVRGQTMEGDLKTLMPCEHRANTTRLIQMLKQGHHDVCLEPEAWERLYAWIDLNTPCWGSWRECVGNDAVAQGLRRRSTLKAYAGVDYQPGEVFPVSYQPPSATPSSMKPADSAHNILHDSATNLGGWPFDAREARRRQISAGSAIRTVALPGGTDLRLVRIPAGTFVMGDPNRTARYVQIESDFWMAATEITNAQFRLFDPQHDSRVEPRDNAQFCEKDRGTPCNLPQQPVVRVSWQRANAFCQWLSRQTDRTFRLPTGAEWEYACRAGSDSPMWWGDTESDFSQLANLADKTFGEVQGIYGGKSVRVPPWRPAVDTVDDGHHVAAPVATFAENPWRLYDMQGNVAEWIADAANHSDQRIARGGSWYDRPQSATATAYVSYPAWQGVFDVGFRIVMDVSHTEE